MLSGQSIIQQQKAQRITNACRMQLKHLICGNYSAEPKTALTVVLQQYWDVFEPYRGMKRRRKKHRHDAADTVNKVFAIVPDSSQPSEETKPVNSPAAFSHKTEDTHRKLFAFDQDMPLPSEESKPVCSPARFTHKTPKVIKVSTPTVNA